MSLNLGTVILNTIFNSTDDSKGLVLSTDSSSTGTFATLSFATVANRIYSFPDVGTNTNIVLTDGTQTINGNKTFTGTVNLSSLTASLPLLLDGSNNIITGDINLTSQVTGTLPIANGGTNSTSTPTAGGVSFGTGTAFSFTAAGTSNQVLTSNGAAAPTWTTLSSIGVTSFSAGTTGLTPNTPTTGAIVLGGTLVIAHGGTNATTIGLAGSVAYSTGTAYSFTAVGTSNQVLTSAGAGTPTWTSLSSLGVTSFSAGTTGLTPNVPTTGDVVLGGTLIAANGGTGHSLFTIGDILYADTTSTLALLSDVAIGSVLLSGGTNTAPNWGKVNLTSMVTGILPIANGGTNSGTALSNNRIMVSSGGAIVEASALTNGQLLIGSTGAAPIAATISGTTNQVIVTNGAGSITLSLPQNINTGASPTFASINLTNTTNQLVLGTTNTVTINSVAPAASRVYTIPDTGANSSFVMTDGNQTINGTKTFAGTINMSALTASLPLQLDGSKNIISAAINLTSQVTGTLPIANGGTNTTTIGSAGSVAYSTGTLYSFTLVGTAGQVLTSNGAASPTWSSLSSLGVTSFSAGTTGLTPNTPTTGAIVLGGTLIAANGGTGFASFTIGDMLYADTISTLAKLNITAAGNVLLSGATPSWGKVNLTSMVTGILPIANGGTNSGTALSNNRIMVSSGGAIVEAAALTNGQLLIGSTGTAPVAATISGTTNQVIVTNGAGSITLSLPQNINTGASPTFASINLTNVTNQLVLGTTNTVTINSVAPAASRTYTIPDTGANSSFVMTDGNQTINGTKTFSGTVNLSSLTASLPLQLDVSKNIISAAINLTSQVTGTLSIANGGTNATTIGSAGSVAYSTGTAYSFTAVGTAGQVLTSNGAGAPTWTTTGVSSFSAGTTGFTPNTPTSGAVVLAGTLVIANGGTNSSTALVNNRIMISSGGAIVEGSALTNGQIFIGSTGLAPVAATISGTTNQVIVTNGAGTITLSLPQNINTGASPTFASINLTNVTNQLVLGTTNTVTISSTAPAASRTYIIPDTGANSSFVMTDGNQTINGTKTFAGTVNMSALTASLPLQLDGSKNIISANINLTSQVTGVLPILNGGTNGIATPIAGGVAIGTGTAYSFTAVGASGQVLTSNGTSSPTWSSISSLGVASFSAGTTGLTPNTPTTGDIVLAGTLVAANGGTGQSTYTIGDLLYANTSSTLAKLSDISAGSYLRSGGTSIAPLWSTLRLPNAATTGDILYATSSNNIGNLPDVGIGSVLLSGGVGTVPSWGKANLTSVVTGVLPIANGGTNSTATPTAGGVGYGTGTAHAYTAAGTSGQILSSNGTGAPTWVSSSSLSSSSLITFNSNGSLANQEYMTQTGMTTNVGFAVYIFPRNCTVSNMYFGLQNSGGTVISPGSGNSWVATLWTNTGHGTAFSASTLAVTISGASTSGNSANTVSVNAGYEYYVRITSVLNPTSTGGSVSFTCA